ncbi:GTP-binding protein Di-Ras2-like [Panulirus ornatus]|uniref:GTP-binding protein Di-Ras2-like n=1 Tax=Panulirus ornatus TaxID=150431 RepID=UPI003A86580F
METDSSKQGQKEDSIGVAGREAGTSSSRSSRRTMPAEGSIKARLLAAGGSPRLRTRTKQTAVSGIDNGGSTSNGRDKMPEQSNDYRVVVFGAGGVGKSSLVLRFVKGTFRESYIPTIEDTYRQVISCNKNICTLQITDTTGSHQFPAMQRLSISKGHAFILVYSITSRQSLEELRPIWEVIREIKGNEVEFPIMLVGNKCDEGEAREVQSSHGETQAKAWKCNFMETSAKTNHNVKELFQELLNMEKNRNMSLQLDGKKNKSQKGTRKIKEKCLLM